MSTHEVFWHSGTHITERNIWHGQVLSAFLFILVGDTATRIMTDLPPGTMWKRPVDLTGHDLRLPHGAFRGYPNPRMGRTQEDCRRLAPGEEMFRRST
jgi:hypothetical protein